jgi:hypothetical protein
VRRLGVSLAMVLAITVAGCGHPFIPSDPVNPKTAASAGTSEWPVLGKSNPVLGVDLYALDNYTPAEVRADGQRTLAYIKNVLKANAVGFVWNFYAPSATSDVVESTPSTLSFRNLSILTKIAIQDHLLVEYRPLILVLNSPSNWEGRISPLPEDAWFNSYYHVELPYLKLAQQLRVPEFVTGTELWQLNSSYLWPSFFARVAQVYHGVISYGAWDGNYFGAQPGQPFQKATPQLLPVKYVGMDMYWHMNLQTDATSAEVTTAWESLFGKAPASVLRRTAIDETGIEAGADAYSNPQDLGQPSRLKEQVQANWFTAACATVERYHMRGVFFFKVDLADNPAHPATSLSTFEGRAGATAISKCARILR